MDSQVQSVNEPQLALTPTPPTYEAVERETEVKKILLSQDFQSIIQILRFRLYEHKDSLQVLQHRWSNSLDKILINLDPTRLKDNDLSRTQYIDAILRLVEPTPPSPVCCSWSRSWKPTNETDARKIAAEINEESCSLFRKVSFTDWLRHAIGYQEESVAQLLFQHDCLSTRLSSHLRRHLEEIRKYLEVKKVN